MNVFESLSGRAVAVLTAALLAAPSTFAQCSRPIVVPASPLGKMVVVDEATGQVSGIYPELLRAKGAKLGCSFEFPVASRARAEMMVQGGSADLLVGATADAGREQWGSYVPMIRVEWLLVSNGAGPVPQTVAELLAMRGIRFNAVRGYHYGSAYLEMLSRLDSQGQLELVASPETIAKKMLAGRVDYSFMPSSTFAGALDRLGVDQARRDGFQYTRLNDMPASTSGVYVSRRLSAADARVVNELLRQMRVEGAVFERASASYTKRELLSLSPLSAKERAQCESRTFDGSAVMLASR